MSNPTGHGPQHDPAPLPEPSSPMWLPALGLGLFVAAAIWWATRPAPPPPPADTAPAASASASAAPAASGSAPPTALPR